MTTASLSIVMAHKVYYVPKIVPTPLYQLDLGLFNIQDDAIMMSSLLYWLCRGVKISITIMSIYMVPSQLILATRLGCWAGQGIFPGCGPSTKSQVDFEWLSCFAGSSSQLGSTLCCALVLSSS